MHCSRQSASFFNCAYYFDRCLGKCTQDNCLLAGWGSLSADETECRVLTGDALPVSDIAIYSSVAMPLTIYIKVSTEDIQFHQGNFGILIHSAVAMTWSDTRTFCRSYGLGMFSPTTKQEMEDVLNGFNFWIGNF